MMNTIRLLFLLSLTFGMFSLFTTVARAETDCTEPGATDQQMVNRNAEFYDPCEAQSQSCSVDVGTTGDNRDYAGREILTQAQLDTIAVNKKDAYDEAAQKVGIPWQMIAVIHIRETNLKRENPSNGQGIYQFVSRQGGPYPTGPVSLEEFKRQTLLAAEFIKGKGGDKLTTNADQAVIKDTFFGYNGRAQAYVQQAQSLGFTEGYEGSPYVMNKADAKRDPEKNPTGWGQIKTDGGGIVYPANNDYGAFIQYAALAGVNLGGACGSTNEPVRQKVVALARQELELWKNGTLKPGDGYFKYSQDRRENWCADFVSWIYNAANYPLKDTNDGNVPSVDEIRKIGEAGGKFKFNPSVGYTPRPGDIVVQKNHAISLSHVMIVVAVDGNKITVIGGNQGGPNGFPTSKVTEYSITGFTSDDIVGYVSPEAQ